MVHLAAVALIAAALLPSALRAPNEQQTTSAEFSPDAPPDESAESLFQSLNQARSSTAGAGSGLGATDEASPTEDGTAPEAGAPAEAGTAPLEEALDAPKVPARRTCFGVGPAGPRAAESVYSAPCVAKWTGDNGGATSKGVTENEIRVGLFPGPARYSGPVPFAPQPDENDAERTLRVMQSYLNDRFEIYGRTLRIYSFKGGIEDAEAKYPLFAGIPQNPAGFHDGLIQRKVISFGGFGLPHEWYAERAPYSYGWYMEGDLTLQLAAEYVCKKLHGRPVAYSEPFPAGYNGQERVFGILYYNNDPWERNGQKFTKYLKDECGIAPKATVGYGLSDQDRRNQIATAMARLKTDGVTTVINMSESVTQPAMCSAADSHQYYPEWYTTGLAGIATNGAGQRCSPAQQKHTFGVQPLEMPRPEEELDWYRAYKAMEPDGEPDEDAANGPRQFFYHLLMLANGAQMAGPNLTPETFQEGLIKAGTRRGDPIWAIGGGIRRDDYTYADDVAEIWWDPTATDPVSGNPGAYKYVRDGRRFGRGEVPREEPLVFKEGTTGYG